MNKQSKGKKEINDEDELDCYACSNFTTGNGYCARHSTSGNEYRIPAIKVQFIF